MSKLDRLQGLEEALSEQIKKRENLLESSGGQRVVMALNLDISIDLINERIAELLGEE